MMVFYFLNFILISILIWEALPHIKCIKKLKNILIVKHTRFNFQRNNDHAVVLGDQTFFNHESDGDRLFNLFIDLSDLVRINASMRFDD